MWRKWSEKAIDFQRDSNSLTALRCRFFTTNFNVWMRRQRAQLLTSFEWQRAMTRIAILFINAGNGNVRWLVTWPVVKQFRLKSVYVHQVTYVTYLTWIKNIRTMWWKMLLTANCFDSHHLHCCDRNCSPSNRRVSYGSTNSFTTLSPDSWLCKRPALIRSTDLENWKQPPEIVPLYSYKSWSDKDLFPGLNMSIWDLKSIEAFSGFTNK